MWVVIKPKKIKSLSALYRGGEIAGAEALDSFKFLAPLEIQENIGHEWAEYESIVSRLGQKIVEYRRAAHEGREVRRQTGRAVKDILGSEKGLMGITMAQIATAMSGVSVPTQKLDASLTYTSSPRRQYTFPVTLIDEGNPNMDIMDPVRKLIQYSCAEKLDITKYELPHTFNVYTEPNKIIDIPYAIITAVQPTYKGPYRNGFPSICDLEITFMDLAPLYGNIFKDIKKVTVSDTLFRHIPHLDKYKKFSAYNKRITEQLGAYDVGAGTTPSV
jgi:hypothetical protein